MAVLCEMKIVKHFRVLGDAYHERTRQMHREFHRALLAMVSPWDAQTFLDSLAAL